MSWIPSVIGSVWLYHCGPPDKYSDCTPSMSTYMRLQQYPESTRAQKLSWPAVKNPRKRTLLVCPLLMLPERKLAVPACGINVSATQLALLVKGWVHALKLGVPSNVCV